MFAASLKKYTVFVFANVFAILFVATPAHADSLGFDHGVVQADWGSDFSQRQYGYIDSLPASAATVSGSGSTASASVTYSATANSFSYTTTKSTDGSPNSVAISREDLFFNPLPTQLNFDFSGTFGVPNSNFNAFELFWILDQTQTTSPYFLSNYSGDQHVTGTLVAGDSYHVIMIQQLNGSPNSPITSDGSVSLTFTSPGAVAPLPRTATVGLVLLASLAVAFGVYRKRLAAV